MTFRKAIATSIVVLCFTFHVGMTAIYLLPQNPAKIAISSVSEPYMSEVFYQDWHLFSPHPGFTRDHIWVRWQMDNGHWSTWADPLAKMTKVHESRTSLAAGRRLRIYEGFIKNLVRDYFKAVDTIIDEESKNKIDEAEIVLQICEKSRHFPIARRFALDVAQTQSGADHVRAFQFKIMRFYPKKYSERTGDKLFGRVIEIEFPVNDIRQANTHVE